ncbi:hypothetical protein [Nocardioides conyzicola]|uniref:Uncharacterized protein n=1 Tax=Nocardioides conyzicola TaxID=1651781 RepID=A0ABP8Y5G1_9ACTN
MEDARDGMSVEDSIGSAKPPRPPKAARPQDPERSKRLLLQVIAVAAVATAVFSGVGAWETHQDRGQTKTIYCAFYDDTESSGDDSYDKQQKKLRDDLGC